MAIEIKVPAAGESITSANIAKWYKNDGDSVKKGEPLASLETDKVSNELEAEADGTLSIIVQEGEEVAIGTVIAFGAGGIQIILQLPVVGEAVLIDVVRSTGQSQCAKLTRDGVWILPDQ